jgi:EAL domain-containing protein (putative c-di-GMP-specific phosphodiesterase class I)
LQIELTETAITPDLAQAAALLGQLREMGAAVLLDDFGVGFSSLSRLSRLPIDVLKMDRSFLDNLGEAPEDTAILRAILTLARDLGKLTIAEGVETAEQARLLREAGCPLAQGFYYYPPLTAAEASRVMRGQGPCGNAT